MLVYSLILFQLFMTCINQSEVLAAGRDSYVVIITSFLAHT